jgi:8-oxo-dGTP diphosphatase
MKKILHVAVGVVFDSQSNILIAKRSDDQHQGGLWEFPGGKVEAGESVQQALARELDEEVGIQCSPDLMTPLIQIPFHYPDKSVYLDVWNVFESNAGDFKTAHGKEGQPVVWAPLAELSDYEFPAANKAILNALTLPELIAITPDSDVQVIRTFIESCLKLEAKRKPGIIQLRAPRLQQTEFVELAKVLYPQCWQAGVKLVWNCPLDWFEVEGSEYSAGLHLSVKNQQEAEDKGNYSPADNQWLSASVHNLIELEQAQQLGVDYVLVSSVKKTASHPDAEPLSHSELKAILDNARVPVYGLGGLDIADLAEMKKQGMQGIAGISAFQ